MPSVISRCGVVRHRSPPATWATAIACFVAAFVTVRVEGQSRSSQALAAKIEAHLAPLVARSGFAGVVLVGRGNGVLFERAYGMANVELAAPNRTDTRFRIHSITKQFTAMAVVLLANRGALSLDVSVRTYLPELPEAWHSVTIFELMTHTSGLPQLENQWFETFQRHAVVTELDNLELLVPKIRNDTLATALRGKFSYNNFGYDLLACVVERVSGDRFAEFVRKNIFEPASMKDAGFDARADVANGMYVASAVVPRLASGYNGSPEKLQVAFPLMFGSAGAGGMYATARDLFSYDKALNARRLVGADLERENLTRAFKISDKANYGYGWIIRRPSDSVYYLEHSGGNNGYTADYARYPLDGVCVIVLINRGGVDATEVRRAIARMVLGTKYD